MSEASEVGANARARAERIVREAVATLASQSPPDELIAERHSGKLFGVLPQQPRLVASTRVWRLGILLLDEAAALYRVGDIIVTETERQQGYVSELARSRAELKAAARRGRIPAGTVVNLDVRRIRFEPLDAPLEWRDGDVWLQWASGSWMPLERYVLDRLQLRAGSAR